MLRMLVDSQLRNAPAIEFQWAPTLGGECYLMEQLKRAFEAAKFQWAPTLGGECYTGVRAQLYRAYSVLVSMGTHPWG